jgi:hypothetical protein
MTDTVVKNQAISDPALPWIRNSRFDSWFIIGILALSCLTGIVIIAEPSFFYPILVIDLWFLGYHHVIATFTRLCFDKRSYCEHRFLVFGLTPIIAAVTMLLAWQVGLWIIVTIYFYWQWWHYTRQSWGISRIYRGKDPAALYEDGWLDQGIFYCLPIWGILSRSAEQNERFIGLELWSFPVPPVIVTLVGYLSVGLLLFWLVRRVQAAMAGRLAQVHTMYVGTHFAIFAIAYLVIPDITLGWLMINIWHNAQYILFVWMYNNRRFSNGIDPDARLLSYISQPGRLWLYLLTCVAITGVVYWGVLRAIDWLFFAGLSATIVLYQIANFHHYVVDSLIWKVRKPTMRKTLGLADGDPHHSGRD